MFEIDMVKDCYEYMEHEDGNKMVVCEIPFMSRCIDMLVLSQEDEVISIEFKLSKWRHAIEQAIDHKQGADYAYICLPKRKTTPKLIAALEEAGVGLLIYDPETDEKMQKVVPAPKSNIVVPFFREELLQTAYHIFDYQ